MMNLGICKTSTISTTVQGKKWGADLATLLERVRLPFNIFECELNFLFLFYGEKAVKLAFANENTNW